MGVGIDRYTPEPSDDRHPVAWLGRGLLAVEKVTYRDHKAAGVAHTAVAVLGATAATTAARRAASRLPGGELLVTALFSWASSGGQMLGDVALEIAEHLSTGDIEGARQLLPHLVGRDPSTLDEAQICRAVVESVAENTVDAATSVVLYGASFGATAIWVHRTINTLDAMVGHRSLRYNNFGWASAKADDAANWIPARLSVIAVAMAAHFSADIEVSPSAVIGAASTHGDDHPSPNGGQIEAAFAGALGVSLGGTNVYEGRTETRGTLGCGPPPGAADITRAINLSRRTVEVLTATTLAGVLVEIAIRSFKR